MDAPDLRVSDAERDAAVDRLRAAATEGRLDSDELDERISAALGARTEGELRALLADLPQGTRPVRAPPQHPADVHLGASRQAVLRARTASFLVPNFVCVAIWAATGAGSFWPFWVLLGTGIAFGVFLIRFVLGVDEDDRGHSRGHGGHRDRHRGDTR